MRSALPAPLLFVALLPLSFSAAVRADDGEALIVPDLVSHQPAHDEPDTVVIGEDGQVPDDGQVHYEMDWEGEEHEDAHEAFHKRPDSHAPAGLGADHTHEQGEWMVEYKFMYMNMAGMRQGTTSVSPAEAAAGAGTIASPTDMNMMMHMGHVMYGLTDCVTLYTMFMWTELAMDHVAFPGGPPTPAVPFRTENSDFDDLAAGVLLNLYEGCNSEWIGHLGFTFPTGDIGQRVTTGPPPPPGSFFPYPMRTGAGHVNIRPGLTYKRFNDCGSIGVQAMATIPLHENYRDYSEGTEVQVSWWYAHLLGEHVSASFRVQGYWSDDFDGADPEAPQGQVTTNRPDFQGRSNLNLYGGLNSIFHGHRFAIEAGAPVYQNVQGFQLEQDFFLWTSWSRAF